MTQRDLVVKAVLLALVALTLGAFLWDAEQSTPGIGHRVPDFDLVADNGSRVQLAGLRGKVVIVNFWATWCPPCIEELPSLDRFQRTFANRGVEVVAISVDEDANLYHAFLRDHNLSMRTIRDPDKKVSASYGTFRYPESYITDREGRLVRKIAGPADWMSDGMVSVIQDIISK